MASALSLAMSNRSDRRYRANRARILKGAPVCWICGKRINTAEPQFTVDENGRRQLNPNAPTADHVIAVAKGGSDELSNLRPSHALCNMRKSDKTHADIVRRSQTLQ